MTPSRSDTGRAVGGSALDEALCGYKIPTSGVKSAIAALPAAVRMAVFAVEAVLVCVTDAAHPGSAFDAWGFSC
jgi:hypothetical protein